MLLASYGMSIYTSEVDDHGIDFVAETEKGFFKFQVKSIRSGTSHVYMRKDKFDILDSSLYLLLIRLINGKHPMLYIIPATTWQDENGNVFVYRAYEGKKSKPEYSVNLSRKNIPQLERFKIENMIESIM